MAIEGDNFGSNDFRWGVWGQTATTVALVTTCAGGKQDVMAAEWAMMVSSAPLRFVISVAPSRVTHELVVQSKEFGLNFCSTEQAKLSHVSGSYSLRNEDKWELADFPTYLAKRIGAPMIDGCTLSVECRLVETLPLGDHTLFIGEALWAKYDPDREPLIYHGGKYYSIGERIPKS